MRFDSKHEKECYSQLLEVGKVGRVSKMFGFDPKLKKRKLDFSFLTAKGHRVIVEAKDGYMRTIAAHKQELDRLKAKYRYCRENVNIKRLKAAENDNHSIERNLSAFWHALQHDYQCGVLMTKDGVWTKTWQSKYKYFMEVCQRDRYDLPLFSVSVKSSQYLPDLVDLAVSSEAEPSLIFDLTKKKVIAAGKL